MFKVCFVISDHGAFTTLLGSVLTRPALGSNIDTNTFCADSFEELNILGSDHIASDFPDIFHCCDVHLELCFGVLKLHMFDIVAHRCETISKDSFHDY